MRHHRSVKVHSGSCMKLGIFVSAQIPAKTKTPFNTVQSFYFRKCKQETYTMAFSELIFERLLMDSFVPVLFNEVNNVFFGPITLIWSYISIS